MHHYGGGVEILFHDIVNTVDGHLLRRGGYGFEAGLIRHDQWNGRIGVPVLRLVVTALHSDRLDLVETILLGGEARSVAGALVTMADRAENLR
jgi:hypothetical protein